MKSNEPGGRPRKPTPAHASYLAAPALLFCLSACVLTNALSIPPRDGVASADVVVELDNAETFAYLAGYRLVREELTRRYGREFSDSVFSEYSEGDLIALQAIDRELSRALPDTFSFDPGVQVEPDTYYTRSSVDDCILVYGLQGPFVLRDLFMKEFDLALSGDYFSQDVFFSEIATTALLAGQCSLRKTGRVVHAGDGLRL